MIPSPSDDNSNFLVPGFNSSANVSLGYSDFVCSLDPFDLFSTSLGDKGNYSILKAHRPYFLPVISSGRHF